MEKTVQKVGNRWDVDLVDDGNENATTFPLLLLEVERGYKINLLHNNVPSVTLLLR